MKQRIELLTGAERIFYPGLAREGVMSLLGVLFWAICIRARTCLCWRRRNRHSSCARPFKLRAWTFLKDSEEDRPNSGSGGRKTKCLCF